MKAYETPDFEEVKYTSEDVLETTGEQTPTVTEATDEYDPKMYRP